MALVYNTGLRSILTLHGWNLFTDTLLHVVVPLQYIVYWFIFTQKGTLYYKQGLNWLYFPFAYLLFSLMRGAYYGWYPNPFLNVEELGYTKVIINSVILIAVFLMSGFALIGFDNILGRRKTAA